MFTFFRKEITSIHAAAFLIAAAGFFSRALGLFRDRLLAGEFGASRALDIYYASFQIPDFLFTVFLIGAASSAILPIFLELAERDKKEAYEFLNRLLKLFSVVAAAVSLLIVALAPLIAELLTPGFSPEERRQVVEMTRIMMLSPVFLGVSNIFSSLVQAERKFFIFALTSIFYNLGIIIGLKLFVPFLGAAGLAWGVVFGSLLHMSVQIPAVSHIGFTIRRGWNGMFSKKLWRVVSLSVPRVVALSLNQIMLAVLMALGTMLAPGNITVFNFSNNLRYLPIGIFGVSYAVAAFSKLTDAAIRQEKEEFFDDFSAIVESILFWVVPIAFLIVVLRAHIVRLALGAGYFTWADTRLTAAALAILAAAIIAEALTPLLLRGFYALGNTKFPLIISFITAFIVIASAPFLLSLFSSAHPAGLLISRALKVGDLADVRVLGLVTAFAIGMVVNAVLLWFGFWGEMRRYFGAARFPGVGRAATRTSLAALAAAAMAYAVLYVVSPFIPLSTFWGVLAQALLAFSAAAAFYMWLQYAMGSEEMRSVTEMIRRVKIRASLFPRGIDSPRDG